MRYEKASVVAVAASLVVFMATQSAWAFFIPASLEVDPVDPLPSSVISVAEWSTNGNADGFNVSARIVNINITGGLYTGQHDNTQVMDPYIQNGGLAGLGIDLGVYKYLEVRVRHIDTDATTSPLTNVTMYIRFETTSGTTYGTDRIQFDTSIVPENETFHTYRLDMTGVPAWSGTLTGFRWQPIGGNANIGDSFELDYIRVGQLPEPTAGMLLVLAGVPTLLRRRRAA